MSRLTLLYRRPDQRDAGGGQALRQAAAERGEQEVAVLFDAFDGPALPALEARVADAVRRRAPSASPFDGDLPAALGRWQDALGLRFFIILDRFEDHLAAPPDAPDVAEFDRTLIRLASDPMLELNILLCVDENAAPLLDRLRPYLPDLGEDYLRMPDMPAAGMANQGAQPDEGHTEPWLGPAPALIPEPRLEPGAPDSAIEPVFGLDGLPIVDDATVLRMPGMEAGDLPGHSAWHREPSLPRSPQPVPGPILPIMPASKSLQRDADPWTDTLPPTLINPEWQVRSPRHPAVAGPELEDNAHDIAAGEVQARAEAEAEKQRRHRRFHSLLENVTGLPPDAQPLAPAPFPSPAPAPAFVGPNLGWQGDAAPGAYGFAPPAADQPSAGRSARLHPWMHDRLRRRRLATLRIVSAGMRTSTVLCFTFLLLAALAWELPQLHRAPSRLPAQAAARSALPAMPAVRNSIAVLPMAPAASRFKGMSPSEALGLAERRAAQAVPESDDQ